MTSFTHCQRAGEPKRFASTEDRNLLENSSSLTAVRLTPSQFQQDGANGLKRALWWQDRPMLMKIPNLGKPTSIKITSMMAPTICAKKERFLGETTLRFRRICNMDEAGTDTTKCRRKVIADKRNAFQRIFAIAPEGDRMKGHTTACIATRADGEFEDCCRGFLFVNGVLFCSILFC
jgi:hypothetical protein